MAHDDARTGEERMMNVNMAVVMAAAAAGVDVERFVPLTLEEMRALPDGGLEHACMDGQGQMWGVLAQEEVH